MHVQAKYIFVRSQDIDECTSNAESCDVNAACKNIKGSYTCTCKAGYTGDGQTCSGKIFSYVY